MLVACALIGLMGQLTLQSRALPDEMPRATFERLTGLQIGPADADVTDVVMMDSDMPDMKMADMSDMGGTSRPHHHHDGYCPLCPLLHLPIVVLAFGLAVLLAFLRVCYSPYLTEKVSCLGYRMDRVRPPSTGPPIFS